MADVYNNIAPPDLNRVLEAAKRDLSVKLNCVQIGVIQSFDTSTQLATVKIAMKQVTRINDDDTREVREYPLLLECPVITLFGGDAFLSMPIQSGDSCVIFFNDRQIDNWLNFGDGQAPTVSRAHDISDAICLVGIRPLINPISDYLADGIRIYYSEAASVDLTDDGITMNGNVTINGILTTDYDGKQINHNTHTHGGVAAGGSNTDEPNDI
jgi:hypothetical protein